MHLSQSFKQNQSLTITPMLQRAITFLRLTHVEIIEFIGQEIKNNPLLEEKKRPYESNDFVKFDKQDFQYENLAQQEESLAEHLLWQFFMNKHQPEEREIAELIIHNIDDDGRLTVPFDFIVSQSGKDRNFCSNTWKKIKMLDPIGCGHENLQDCLLIQAEVSGKKDIILEDIIRNHLCDIECGNLKKIAQKHNTSIEKIRTLLETISHFHPKPGRTISFGLTHYIIPDVYVHNLNNEFFVRANNEGIPQLKICALYKEMLGKLERNSSDKAFIEEKMKDASWIIKSLENRQKTITRVVKSILSKQKNFFEQKSQYLNPMTLADIANDIGVHESTVSRATTNKYVSTPSGIFELKYFFASKFRGLKGANITPSSLKEKISYFLNQEDSSRPYTDQKIADLLEYQGIHVARRTIAKYREELGISSSSERKKLSIVSKKTVHREMLQSSNPHI